VRVPKYETGTTHLLIPAWEWVEKTAASLKGKPSVIIGDLNAETSSIRSRGGDHFRSILANGWHRAEHDEPTFNGKGKPSKIDHILATSHCTITKAWVRNSEYSEHAALICPVGLGPSEIGPK
jgi:endonuclease/exonuclease/phosphatase family metal-dependent hydrolase